MSKEKFQGWPYPHGFFPDADVNGDDVSDIIVMTYNKDEKYSSEEPEKLFTNQKTGMSSNDVRDVIQKDRRFVIAKPNDSGYYISIDKENDVFVIYFVTLKEENGFYRWEIARTFGMLRNGLKRGFDNNSEITLLRLTPYDICGQAVLSSKEQYNCKNYSVGAQQTTFEYFGGLKSLYTSNDSTNRTLITFDNPSNMWELLKKFSELTKPNSWKVSKAVILNIGGKYTRGYDDSLKMDIPEKVHKAMEFFIKNLMMDANRKTSNCLQEWLWGHNVSFLQKYKDSAVLRTFRPIFAFRYPIEETEIQLIEIERVWYKKNTRFDENLASYTVWRDADLSGTPFEYSITVTDEFIRVLNEEYKRLNKGQPCNMDAFFEDFDLRNVTNEFENIYTCSAARAVLCDARLAQDPLAEKLVKKIKAAMDKEMDVMRNGRLRTAMNVVIFYSSMGQEAHVYGKVDKQQKELHKMLGVPKHLLDKIIYCGHLDSLGKIKQIFGDNKDNIEYLQHLDDKTCDKLVDFATDNLTIFDARQCLEDIITFKGVKNLTKYIDFIENINREDRAYYFFYAQALADDARADKMFTGMKWNVKGKDLKDAFDTVNALLYLKNIDKKNNIRKLFEKRAEEWKKYLYSDDNFQVLYPKKPEDIVIEGLNLNHCAKEFILPVSRGETNVLFIRKNKCPDVPFFTLEIKEGKIRQCHGFANANVEQDSDLDRFLKKLCEAKKIAYQIGDSALGPVER